MFTTVSLKCQWKKIILCFVTLIEVKTLTRESDFTAKTVIACLSFVKLLLILNKEI